MTEWMPVSIPKDLIEEIELFRKENKGYASRAEVVREAIRQFLNNSK